ncbi:hypothetical protein LJR219_001030 [Phenylobacterium sp. LjRoot219]|uniref:hypothetical protein n=1 Tax=Phenylobacterium sp. LjRoot219 TaxID=3342283 RepID=UPI003ECE2AD5
MKKRREREEPRPAEERVIPTSEQQDIEAREAMLDEALEDTFPASDPPAIHRIT